MKILIVHPWQPVYDENSRLLILGTIPSPKSRENDFYYGHPQNCFWTILARVLGEAAPSADPASKKNFLIKNNIAVWDVLHSCQIDGAADSSISQPVANEFRPILNKSKINAIFTTGKKATSLFMKLCAEEAGLPSIYLPSTSPANRAMHKKPEFIEQWMMVKTVLEK